MTTPSPDPDDITDVSVELYNLGLLPQTPPSPDVEANESVPVAYPCSFCGKGEYYDRYDLKGERRRIIEMIREEERAKLVKEDIERMESIVNSEAYKQMTGKSWSQLDEDGIMVECSRQAIEETAQALNDLITHKKNLLNNKKV